MDLGGARREITIAMLLLNANRVVTVERLLRAIYGEDLPPTCRSQVQIIVSALRRKFADAGGMETIVTHADGYRLQVEDSRLDLRRFEQLVVEGRAAESAEVAMARFRDALRLWRGPALQGLVSDPLQAVGRRLDELRMSVNEDRLNLELKLGRHHELVGELTELVEENPLRERLRGQLMLALHHSGRTAEALRVYQEARQILQDDLGLDPGADLQHLHQTVLRSDHPVPRSTAGTQLSADPVPRLLPTDVGDFTGRRAQLDRLGDCLGADVSGRAAVSVVALAGMGGVGKTSLAVHAAHGLAERFSDGQLFADLHGSSGEPVSPMAVLERFIRAFGLPVALIPNSLDERAETYRNLLANRRVLILLDDARSESQVAPLMPGSGAASVIVTSRDRLTGIPNAEHIELGVLEPAESLELLERIAGSARVRARPTTAAVIARQCAYLPLALRIVGARLSARPDWSMEQLATRLAEDTRRLDELSFRELSVRHGIATVYDRMDEQAQRLFRRLALLDMPMFPRWAGAALMEAPAHRAEDLLDDLVGLRLVESADTTRGQYRLHGLVRLFARERLMAEESPAERSAAAKRARGAQLQPAGAAAHPATGNGRPPTQDWTH